MGKENDGGTFGGIPFTYRPDALSFYYKRSRATAPAEAKDNVKNTYKPNETSTIVAYLWKGTYTQKNVPANIGMLPLQIKKVNMEDRDRNILGLPTTKGDTPCDSTTDAERIAVLNMTIDEDASEWTHFEQPLEYLSNSTPEKANVIIAAGDYWGGSTVVGRDNSLTIDDVRFVYYSRLASIGFNGKEVALEDGKYEYEVVGEMPTDASQIAMTLKGQTAKASTVLDVDNSTVSVTVSNVEADSDGQSSHTYIFKVVPPAAHDTYDGYLYINCEALGGALALNQSAAIEIYEKTGDGAHCDFVLPNFTLGSGAEAIPLGDIKVDNLEKSTNDGVTTYTGTVEGLKLNFMGSEISANVDVNGTITTDGDVNMKIDVLWVDASMPIAVTFTSKPVMYDYTTYIDVKTDGEDIWHWGYIAVRVTPTSPATCDIVLENVLLEKPVARADADKVDLTIKNVAMEPGTETPISNMYHQADGTTTATDHTGKTYTVNSLEGAVVKHDKDYFDVKMELQADGKKYEVNNGSYVSGVEGVVVEEEAPVEYYNLQGQRVEHPESGVFIRRQGTKASKVTF